MPQSFRLEATSPPEVGKAIRVVVNGEPVAVFRVGDELFALGATCTHAGGPLDEGEFTRESVECPRHGSIFALETGEVFEGPATEPVRAYRVRTEGNALILETD